MSTGISISSINRIKELAEERKFKEALEILDTQNLDKSINPQFLKISGEIFRENKRYYDSRRILLKAHQMAPQGNRILHELIQLYLELGYFSKAQKYYEQYMFYATPEDTQKDYVEYIMKKATGADVKDLAAILIPILERMPEDQWNFEAILLYDKMDRKDMALEESRYILENFKESEFVQPVIEYIDDKLDIDKWFYVYPKEEQPEDTDLFGDLIELEEKILEADHLRMYPPEARIMVEAEDKDAIDVAPIKEKKPRKTIGLFKKTANASDDEDKIEDAVLEDAPKAITGEDKKSEDKTEQDTNLENSDAEDQDQEAVLPNAEEDTQEISQEEQIKQEREATLEKILAKKIDKDKIKESAKQVANAVKEMDTDKAKKQVKSVAATVKSNVKKATEVIGEAVGTKVAVEDTEKAVVEKAIPDEEIIMDGIIEGVLEPPKKAIGQVVMNEELDALIPDSLEAMSEQEIADIEAKKEEIERLELEALETTLKLEEEKKAKRQALLKIKSNQEASDEANQTEMEETSDGHGEVQDVTSENDTVVANEASDEDQSNEADVDNSSYAELKNRFMEELEEDKPLESLGFITVVHSDVDAKLEDEVPDAAGMLRQMIDNKEFYSGENSLGFESEASYLNHGFEIEDCDFDTYRQQLDEKQESNDTVEPMAKEEDVIEHDVEEDTPTVQEIFAQESVVAFEDVADVEEPIIVEEAAEPIYEELEKDNQRDYAIVEEVVDLRAHMRANIALSDRMENILQELKRK